MNRNDLLEVRSLLAQLHATTKATYDATTAKAPKQQLGRKLDRIVALHGRIKVPAWKPKPVPKLKTVGTCPCGEDVTLGEGYAVKTSGHTTIRRPCGSCGRQNDVVLTVLHDVRTANWKVRDCFCGTPILLRSDYAGYGFNGYDGPYDPSHETRKNRTIKTDCRSCGCKWSFSLRFEKSKEDVRKMERFFSDILVTRCKTHAAQDIPGLVTPAPKKKRAAKV